MTSTIGITSTAQTNSTIKTTTAKNKMGEEDFMLLLLTQLKTQNPLEPMSNQELMGQMTQLNSLSALKNIEEAMKTMSYEQKMTYSTSLIGKEVTWKGEDGNRSGKVTDVVVEANKVYVRIGDELIALADVVGVKDSSNNINIAA